MLRDKLCSFSLGEKKRNKECVQQKKCNTFPPIESVSWTGKFNKFESGHPYLVWEKGLWFSLQVLDKYS